MVREHDFFLQGLERGVIIKKDLLHELSAADDDEVIDELLNLSPLVEPANQLDIDALRQTLSPTEGCSMIFRRKLAVFDLTTIQSSRR